MTQDEQQFRALYPEIDTILHHSPLRARFLLMTFLYNNTIRKNSIEEKDSKANTEKDS